MIVTLGAKEILWDLCIYAYKNFFKKTLVSTCIAQIDNRQEARNRLQDMGNPERRSGVANWFRIHDT